MRILIAWLLLITLAACAAPAAPAPTSTPTPPAVPATVGPTVAPTPAPTQAPLAPAARQYTLGQAEATVQVGDGVVEPLELRGTIAIPAGPGPHPVALVLHGSHAVCPPDPRSPEEPEICPQATQFRNDPGLGYLLETLAAQGTIALAPDLNTAFRAEFGGLEQESARVQFIAERHLEALAVGDPAFGVGVTVDPTRLDLIGHSRGGTWAFALASTWANTEPAPGGWQAARSLLLIAPLISAGVDRDPPPDVPLAVVLPECDGDASFLEGQHYVEAARIDPNRRSPAIAYFLPGANHNFFNAAVTFDDSLLPFSRCLAETPRLSAAAQQRFLAGLASTLLAAWAADDSNVVPGFDPAEPLPSILYDVPVQLGVVHPAEQRRLILPGLAADELITSPLGGAVRVEGAALDYCPYGMAGNGGPCRAGVEIPGMPAQLHLAWEAPAAAVRVAIPPPFADASAAAALQLRLAVDPLDPRSAAGEPQRINVILRDTAGNAAAQAITVAAPGGALVNERWFGHVFLSAYRLPLSAFAGVDPAQLAEVALEPERSSGAVFFADLELVSTGAIIAGPPQPAPYRSLNGSVAVPELDAAPAGSSLIVRLVFAGDATEPRFVTIQSSPVTGTPPFAFTLRYLQPAIDERREYVLDANLLLPDGRSFNLPTPVPAISAGQPQADIALTLAPVVITEPTPIPTDATFQLTVRAPAGQPLPPGALVSVTLSQLDANGVGVATLAGANATVGAAPGADLVIELPYPSSAIVSGAPYGVSVDVFAADGMTRLAGTNGNIPVDLAAGAATVQLTPAAP